MHQFATETEGKKNFLLINAKNNAERKAILRRYAALGDSGKTWNGGNGGEKRKLTNLSPAEERDVFHGVQRILQSDDSSKKLCAKESVVMRKRGLQLFSDEELDEMDNIRRDDLS